MQLENLLPLIPTYTHTLINVAHLVPKFVLPFFLYLTKTQKRFRNCIYVRSKA